MNMVPQHHNASVTALAQGHSAASETPSRNYTHTVYRCRSGSGPIEQQKKMDLD
jgi:hypothetical protein